MRNKQCTLPALKFQIEQLNIHLIIRAFLLTLCGGLPFIMNQDMLIPV